MHEIWMRELMAMVSGWLMNYLARSVVTLTILGAMAWLNDRLLRRVGPLAQHRLWVVALLVGVLLPLLPAGMLAHYFSHADASTAGGTVAIPYRMIAAGAGHWAVSPLLSQMLTMAYLLALLFCVARLLWRCQRTRTMARRATALLDTAARTLVAGVARQFGVTAPEVRCVGEVRGPVVLGLRRAMLLVPEEFFAAQNYEDTVAALAHECAHIARRDFAKNVLYEFVAAAVAYHPACWLMRRRIAETRELVCDEMAARAVGDRPEYAASLLRLATAMAWPAARQVYVGGTQAIGVFDADILEERIMRLTMDLPTVSKARSIAMAAVTSCALLGGAATAAALSVDVTPQDGAVTSASAHEKIYKVGNGVMPPVLTYSVDAEFTKKAKDAKHQGVSIVLCVVDSHGIPQHVHTVKKLGMGLDEKALEAVRQYKFKPSTLNGKPVAVAITIEVNFHIY